MQNIYLFSECAITGLWAVLTAELRSKLHQKKTLIRIVIIFVVKKQNKNILYLIQYKKLLLMLHCKTIEEKLTQETKPDEAAH